MKLTYWVAKSNDSPVYDVRERTKKAVLQELFSMENDRCIDISGYDAPKKVTVEYESTFELLHACLGENNRHWE